MDGTFTENQPNDATPAGLHRDSTALQNFPMWTYFEGATTGCLLPMKKQTNVAIYLQGPFRFYPRNLEPKIFL